MKMRKIYFLSLLFLLVLLSGCATTLKQQATLPESIPSSGMSPTLNAQISFVDEPLLNKVARIQLKISSIFDAENVEANIKLPEDFQLVEGNLWNGNLKKDQEQIIDFKVKATSVGYHRIIGLVKKKMEGQYETGSSFIDVEVTPTEAVLGSRPKNHWVGGNSLGDQMGGVTQRASIDSGSSALKHGEIESYATISPTPVLDKEFTLTYRLVPKRTMDIRLMVSIPQKGFALLGVEGADDFVQLAYNDQIDLNKHLIENEAIELKIRFKVLNSGFGIISDTIMISDYERTGSVYNIGDKEITLYIDKYKSFYSVRELNN